SLQSSLGCLLAASATTQISALSLHDALPISSRQAARCSAVSCRISLLPEATMFCLAVSFSASACRFTSAVTSSMMFSSSLRTGRSEEHTSELQSRENLVCRLLLEKKKQKTC